MRPTRERKKVRRRPALPVSSHVVSCFLTPMLPRGRPCDRCHLEVAGQGLNPACLTLTYVLSTSPHSLRATHPCGVSAAPCMMLHNYLPHWGRRHGLLQFFRVDPWKWLPGAAKLPPCLGDISISIKSLSLGVKDSCVLSSHGPQRKPPGSLYWGLSVPTLPACGR